MTPCRNKTYDHECHPHYAKKYDGYCLDCANAGVPALLDERDALRAVAETYLAELVAREYVMACADDGCPPGLLTLRRTIGNLRRLLAEEK
jgi:hypothetical protein